MITEAKENSSRALTELRDLVRGICPPVAIRSVAVGGTVLDPEVVQKLMVRHSRTEPVTRLTPREREVLALMAEGAPTPPSPSACSSARKRSANMRRVFSSS